MSARELQKHYKTWTNGEQVLLNAEIDKLSDAQLGKCLAHHQYTFMCPVDWFPSEWGMQRDGYVTARWCRGQKSTFYLECE
eukprot:2045930-Rhodomonas_salina.1